MNEEELSNWWGHETSPVNELLAPHDSNWFLWCLFVPYKQKPEDRSVLFSSLKMLLEVMSFPSLNVLKQQLDKHLVGMLLTKSEFFSQMSLKTLGSENMSVKRRKATSSQESQTLIRVGCVASPLTLYRSLPNFFKYIPLALPFQHISHTRWNRCWGNDG